MKKFAKYVVVTVLAFFAGVLSASALDNVGVGQKLFNATKYESDTMGNVSAYKN